MVGFNPRLVSTESSPEARAPDGVTLYAIGDLHGRADLLKLLIDRIRSDRAGTQDRAEVIFLGDYIDRGPDSKAVIDQVLDLQDEPDFSVTTLKGNHESLALHFLTDPAVGPFWCRIGGRQTLLSYGVPAPDDLTDMEQWEAIRQAFEAALPETHLSFLQALPVHAERGSYLFVHAGLRPGVGLAQQREWDMLWIRHEFLNYRGPFEKVVVHGHTSEAQPFVGLHRIGIDTGADVTNRLTGLKLVGADRQLFSVSSAPARCARAAEPRNTRPAARPPSAWPPPPLPTVSPARDASMAPAPGPHPTKWAQARISAALPAALAALVAVGYLAAPLVKGDAWFSQPEAGAPQNGRTSVATPGAGGDIDDAIARAEKALQAAKGSPPTPEVSRAGTSGARSSAPAQAVPVTVQPAPDRRAPQTRTAKAVTPPPSTPAATRAAAPAPRAATADRKAAAPPPAKPAASAGKPKDPSRTASSTGPEASNRQEPEPRSRPSPRSSRAPDAAEAPPVATAQAPARRDDTRPAGETAAAAGNRQDQSASSEPPATYTRSVPIEGANRIGQDDYPDASIQAGEEGVVGVRYVVDTTGRVSTCAATETSNHTRLDKRTCDLIRRRFRFKPAVRNGQPVQEVREQRIRWMLCPGQEGWGMSSRNDQRSDRPCPA